jgi:superoxide dismutase, Fe-Mn family
MSNRFTNRREFLITTGKASVAAGFSFSALSSLAADDINHRLTIPPAATPYEQTPLPYEYKALEPVIDAQTMELHYSKHAAAYAKALGEAVTAEKVNKQSTSLEQLLARISKYSAKMRNNAGGHYNHELFWRSMQAPSDNNKPSGKLATDIEKHFNSFEAFKNQFSEAAKNRFGSGWAWLIASKGKLTIASTPNQDNPLMDLSEAKGFPVLGLDVWEHAYYLKYQNKRPDYISAWWNVVNWKFIEDRYAAM